MVSRLLVAGLCQFSTRPDRIAMSNRSTKRLPASIQRTGSATRLLLEFVLFSSVLVLIAGCRLGAPVTSDDTTTASLPKKSGERPPIDPAVLRADAERQAEWTPFRQAKCPRQLPDRHEELRRYPAISILQGLGYLKITDGTAYGSYVKNVEITMEGRRELGRDIEEEGDYYVITIASREYLPGTERFEILPGPDRLVAHFKWRWKPTNTLGERLTLGPSHSNGSDYGGFATYNRSATGWTLDKVYLNSDNRDYMRGGF